MPLCVYLGSALYIIPDRIIVGVHIIFWSPIHRLVHILKSVPYEGKTRLMSMPGFTKKREVCGQRRVRGIWINWRDQEMQGTQRSEGIQGEWRNTCGACSTVRPQACIGAITNSTLNPPVTVWLSSEAFAPNK